MPKPQRSQTSGDAAGMLGPDWRLQIVAQPERLANSTADEWIHQLQQFIRCANERGESTARQSFPVLAAAQDLNALSARADVLRLAVIGGLSADEIASRLSIDPAHIETWEKIYFDVRKRAKATDWLMVHVIDKEQKAGRYEQASNLALAAAGGPVITRALLDETFAVPRKEATAYVRDRERLVRKFHAAMNAPLDSADQALRFQEVFLNYQLADGRLALADKKLTASCMEAVRRHERDVMRLAAQAKRAETDAAKHAATIDRHRREAEAFERFRQEALEPLPNRPLVKACSGLAALAWNQIAGSAEAQKQDTLSGAASPGPSFTDEGDERDAWIPADPFSDFDHDDQEGVDAHKEHIAAMSC